MAIVWNNGMKQYEYSGELPDDADTITIAKAINQNAKDFKLALLNELSGIQSALWDISSEVRDASHLGRE